MEKIWQFHNIDRKRRRQKEIVKKKKTPASEQWEVFFFEWIATLACFKTLHTCGHWSLFRGHAQWRHSARRLLFDVRTKQTTILAVTPSVNEKARLCYKPPLFAVLLARRPTNPRVGILSSKFQWKKRLISIPTFVRLVQWISYLCRQHTIGCVNFSLFLLDVGGPARLLDTCEVFLVCCQVELLPNRRGHAQLTGSQVSNWPGMTRYR